MRKLLPIGLIAALCASFALIAYAGDDEPQETLGASTGEGQYEEALESGDLAERYNPDEDGYYIEEVQTPEQEQEAQEQADQAELDKSHIDGYIPEGEALAGEPYSIIESLEEVPPQDRRFVCGYATNVFVGEVLEPYSEVALDPDAVEGETTEPLPRSQFLVNPISGYPEIKGTLDTSKRVLADDATTLAYVVNQTGGPVGEGVELKEGDPLLIPGEQYLFSTHYDADNEWYTIIVQPQGDIRVSSESELERKVRDMTKACKYEKTPEDMELGASVLEDEDPAEAEQYYEEEPDYILGDEGPNARENEEE